MDVADKLCVITGANSGIGKETVRALARQKAYIIMICRNRERAEAAREEIMSDTGHTGIEIMLADLAHQHDVRDVACKITDQFEAVDLLINNAGIIAGRRRETPEGIERTLAINHLAPFLLTNLLHDQLLQAHEARIITVSSEVHRMGAGVFDLDDLQLGKNYSPMKAYGVSKLCNIMFTHELAKRCVGTSITANCLHPGVVRTQLAEEANWLMKLFYLVGKPFMRSPKSGAATSVYLAISDEVRSTSGKYFKNKREASPASIAFDDAVTSRLWERSLELTDLSEDKKSF